MVGLRKGLLRQPARLMCNDVIPATGEHLWDEGNGDHRAHLRWARA